jgi:hypothetical protein
MRELEVKVGSFLLVMTGMLGCLSQADAAGKKPAEPGDPASAAGGLALALRTPKPFRPASLKPVGTRPFQLPNGSRVDLTADLDTILSSSVTQQTRFLPLEAGEDNPDCSTRIELRANVSTFEMNVADIGLSFGWTPTGEIGGTVTNVTGKTNVKIGTISMDFGAWQCTGSRCVELAAATATHATAGVNLNVTVNFSEATTAADFIWNSALGDALRAIMEDGLKKLEKNARVSKLTWYATVKEFNEKEGSLIFDAGTSSSLAPGDAFEVYARTPSLSACDVYKTVAQAHALRVDTRSTLGVVDSFLDERGIEAGDIVMIREIP